MLFVFDLLAEGPKSLTGVPLSERRSRLEAFAEAHLEGDKSAIRLSPATTDIEVFCMEWLDPVYCSGHWMSQMVRIAGGVDELSRDGTDSVRIPWEDVLKWAPEVLILTPCGFNLDKVIEQAPQIYSYPGWSELPAVRQGRVYAVDANSYFARPGPRAVAGTELLAHLTHPDLFSWEGPEKAYRRLES